MSLACPPSSRAGLFTPFRTSLPQAWTIPLSPNRCSRRSGLPSCPAALLAPAESALCGPAMPLLTKRSKRPWNDCIISCSDMAKHLQAIALTLNLLRREEKAYEWNTEHADGAGRTREPAGLRCAAGRTHQPQRAAPADRTTDGKVHGPPV